MINLIKKSRRGTSSFNLSVKGLALVAAIENDLLPEVDGGWNDSKFQSFWTDFKTKLAEHGYSIFKICKD